MEKPHCGFGAVLRQGAMRLSNTPTRLLLVDDEALLLLDLEATLTEEGFEVVAASSGTAAMAEIDKDPSSLIALVTDIRLVRGPDGWSLGHRIRELVPAIPVIYMSGDSASDWDSKGVPRSVMLQKPFVNAQLVTALATLLNEASNP